MIKNKKAKITYGIHASPFGKCLIAIADEGKEKGVCRLSFLDSTSESEALNNIKTVWPEAKIVRNDQFAKGYINKIFSSKALKHSPNLVMKGTDFQMKVWKALLKIPSGKIASYAKIARAVGSPKAVRAVGTACGKNSIGYLIPCHRVLTSQGKMGGYRWGVKRKEAMLAWEAVR